MANYYVSADNGTGGAPGDILDPVDTITAAVALASDNDTIYVDGSGSEYAETVNFSTKKINFVGTNGSFVVDGTRAVIDATGQTYGMYGVATGFPSKVEVQNFEIKNATSHGFYRTTSSGNDALFMHNVSSHDNGGSGVYIQRHYAHIYNACEFCDNGGYGWESNVTQSPFGLAFFGCVITGNTSGGIVGRDIYNHWSMATGCVIAGNGGVGATGIRFMVSCVLDDATSHGWTAMDNSNVRSIGWFSGFSNNGGYGVANADQAMLRGCGFYTNTSGNLQGTPFIEDGSVTTDPDYVNAATFDFTLDAATTWGANSITFANGIEFWSDIGFGRDDPAGGSGRTAVIY